MPAVHHTWGRRASNFDLSLSHAALTQPACRGPCTTNEDGSVVAAVVVRAEESIGFSERTHSWLSFYPRRWVGIIGLLAIVAILVCLVTSLFMPVGSELSTPAQWQPSKNSVQPFG